MRLRRLAGSHALPKLLSIQELSILLHLSPQTIRNILANKPHLLPPAVRFKGMRRVYFSVDDVAVHLSQKRIKQPSKNIKKSA
jgi:hypothetical protein